MAVTNITQEILDWYNVNDSEVEATEIDTEVWEEFYYALSTKQYKENYPNATTPVLPSGPAYNVEDFGGEGQGEERWVVFSVGDQLFKVEGYYASWDGTTWDDPTPFEVKPKDVVVVRYEAI
jgi:hypothetical protein